MGSGGGQVRTAGNSVLAPREAATGLEAVSLCIRCGRRTFGNGEALGRVIFRRANVTPSGGAGGRVQNIFRSSERARTSRIGPILVLPVDECGSSTFAGTDCSLRLPGSHGETKNPGRQGVHVSFWCFPTRHKAQWQPKGVRKGSAVL